MGDFHCIPSDCARVVWHEYLPAVIRWRYPNEDWQKITGDDYTIEDRSPKYNTVASRSYKIKGKAVCIKRSPPARYKTLPLQFQAGEVIEVYISGNWSGGIYNWELIENGVNCNSNLTYLEHTSYNTISSFCRERTIELIVFTRNKSDNNVRCKASGESTYEPILNLKSLHDIECIEQSTSPSPCRNDIPSECLFTVFSQDEIVHQETRDVCPEVEKIPCRLSDEYKEIKIEKVPYLSSIQVIRFGRDAEKVKFVPYPLPNVYAIPNECWNIYRQEIWDLLPEGNPRDVEPVFGDYIAQICSAPGCPRPEYEVICNCDEKCPPGTCEIQCGNVICCYNDEGIAVKSIPLG